MAKKGMLLTISGPTGAKKDKVIEALLKKDNNLVLAKSFTTREKREDEIEGYEYLDKKEFLKRDHKDFSLNGLKFMIIIMELLNVKWRNFLKKERM